MDVLDVFVCFFFQAEDGIRDLVRSRGLGDVYKRQGVCQDIKDEIIRLLTNMPVWNPGFKDGKPVRVLYLSLIHI